MQAPTHALWKTIFSKTEKISSDVWSSFFDYNLYGNFAHLLLKRWFCVYVKWPCISSWQGTAQNDVTCWNCSIYLRNIMFSETYITTKTLYWKLGKEMLQAMLKFVCQFYFQSWPVAVGWAGAHFVRFSISSCFSNGSMAENLKTWRKHNRFAM